MNVFGNSSVQKCDDIPRKGTEVFFRIIANEK